MRAGPWVDQHLKLHTQRLHTLSDELFPLHPPIPPYTFDTPTPLQSYECHCRSILSPSRDLVLDDLPCFLYKPHVVRDMLRQDFWAGEALPKHLTPVLGWTKGMRLSGGCACWFSNVFREWETKRGVGVIRFT